MGWKNSYLKVKARHWRYLHGNLLFRRPFKSNFTSEQKLTKMYNHSVRQ